jgi:predicted adenine nucleotide alpha hydrolase (AANH) superfamily ATPase
MLANGLHPTVFYFNPNIYPQAEYEHRKAENIRYVESLQVPFVDGDYDHSRWLLPMHGLEQEPERGRRCLLCFKMRLSATAQYASKQGFTVFTTTLASSRWKNLSQINEAGRHAAALFPGLTFWEQNWRKNGLSDRRNELIKQYHFYNQTYCGCEYSLARSAEKP